MAKLRQRWQAYRNRERPSTAVETAMPGAEASDRLSTEFEAERAGDTCPTDEDAAELLYWQYLDRDPYPDVPPALLNSGHVGDYMEKACLVYPYEQERRKAASYAMRLGDEIAFADPHAARPSMKRRKLDDGEIFTLKPNSLVFVRTRELFQLPNYIAARFNLHIDLVHKGLLLGTGPLVDPGFRGRLLVPLHNMTANEYELRAGDEFIWAEFTKTTMAREWTDHDEAIVGKEPRSDLRKFDVGKKNKPMEHYLDKARKPLEGSETRSERYDFPANAVPETIAHAERVAGAARKIALETEERRKTFQRWNVAVGVAILVGVLTLYYMTVQVVVAGQEIMTGSATQGGVEDLDGLISSELAYDRSFLEAQILFMEFCSSAPMPTDRPRVLKVATPEDGARLTRMVNARRAANSAALEAERSMPYPNPERFALADCPTGM